MIACAVEPVQGAVFFYDADACIGVFLRASGKSCLIDTTGLNGKGRAIR